MTRAGVPALFLAAGLAAGTARGMDVTADSAGRLGPDNRWSDVASLTISPVKRVSLVISGGRSRVEEPLADRIDSAGAAVSAELVPRVTGTVGWLAGTGARARLIDGSALAPSGNSNRRERHSLYSFDLAVRAFDAATGEAADEDAFLQSVTLAVGATTGAHRMPLEAVGGSPAGLPSQARVADLAMTGGVTLEMEGTTLSVATARHRYGWPAGIDRGPLDGLFGAAPDGVEPVFPGLPNWDVAVRYREALPWQGASATLSYAYTRLVAPPGIARTFSAELGWSLARWLSVRGGILWLRHGGETTRFGLGGASLFF